MGSKTSLFVSGGLQKISDDCNHFGNRVPFFLDIVLRRIEKNVLNGGGAIGRLEVRDRDFSNTGKTIRGFVKEYMRCSVDRSYEITRPMLPRKNGIMIFTSEEGNLSDISGYSYRVPVNENISPVLYGQGRVLKVNYS